MGYSPRIWAGAGLSTISSGCYGAEWLPRVPLSVLIPPALIKLGVRYGYTVAGDGPSPAKLSLEISHLAHTSLAHLDALDVIDLLHGVTK